MEPEPETKTERKAGTDAGLKNENQKSKYKRQN